MSARARNSLPNPLRVDPSRTAALRRRWAGKLSAAFGKIKTEVVRLVVDEDAFGLGQEVGPFAVNATRQRWRFLPTPEQVSEFQAWLRNQVNVNVLGKTATQLWEQYLTEAHEKGFRRSYDSTARRRPTDSDPLAEFNRGTKEGFIRAALRQPAAAGRLRLLSHRVVLDLQGATEAMITAATRVVADGLAKNTPPRQLAREINAKVDGIGKKRALDIARTETVRCQAEGQLEGFEAMGVEGVNVAAEWNHTGDGKVCARCSAMQGVVLTPSQARGLIPRHPNCITGDSVVKADDVLALMKTHYTGEIVELVTAKGRRLAVTPNHMLLTEFGFLPACFVHKGLKVFDAAGFNADLVETPDDDGREPGIADVFAAWAEHPAMMADRVPLAPEDLHGDGASCNSEVHVVRPDRELWYEGEPGTCRAVVESAFPSLQFLDAEGGLPAPSAAAKFLERTARTADRSMGRFREAQAVLLGHVVQTHPHRLAAASRLNARVRQSLVDGAAAAPEAFRECLRAHPLLKQLDDLLGGKVDAVQTRMIDDLIAGAFKPPFYRRRTYPQPLFDGEAREPGEVKGEYVFDTVVGVDFRHAVNLPVYDLQTHSTLYRVNGLVTSNCRCAWLASDVGEKQAGQKRTRRAVAAAIRKSTKGEPSSDWPGAALPDRVTAVTANAGQRPPLEISPVLLELGRLLAGLPPKH